MGFAPVLAAAKRAQAAYEEDDDKSKALFEAMGLEWLGQYEDEGHQATVSRDADNVYLSISGTRFSQGKIGDLADDIWIRPYDVGGASVSSGGFVGLDKVWAWAKSLVPADTVWNVEGHSLGGQRSLYTPCFVECSKIGAIHAFEAPKGADSRYWAKYEGELASAVHTVNSADIWYGWPFLSPYCHPDRDTIWLTTSGFSIIRPKDWPGGRSLGDHSIDLIVSRLEKIAAALLKPAA